MKPRVRKYSVRIQSRNAQRTKMEFCAEITTVLCRFCTHVQPIPETAQRDGRHECGYLVQCHVRDVQRITEHFRNFDSHFPKFRQVAPETRIAPCGAR